VLVTWAGSKATVVQGTSRALSEEAFDAALEPVQVDDQPAIMRDSELARPYLAGMAIDLDLGE
jgi:hypothetical protein